MLVLFISTIYIYVYVLLLFCVVSACYFVWFLYHVSICCCFLFFV